MGGTYSTVRGSDGERRMKGSVLDSGSKLENENNNNNNDDDDGEEDGDGWQMKKIKKT